MNLTLCVVCRILYVMGGRRCCLAINIKALITPVSVVVPKRTLRTLGTKLTTLAGRGCASRLARS